MLHKISPVATLQFQMPLRHVITVFLQILQIITLFSMTVFKIIQKSQQLKDVLNVTVNKPNFIIWLLDHAQFQITLTTVLKWQHSMFLLIIQSSNFQHSTFLETSLWNVLWKWTIQLLDVYLWINHYQITMKTYTLVSRMVLMIKNVQKSYAMLWI